MNIYLKPEEILGLAEKDDSLLWYEDTYIKVAKASADNAVRVIIKELEGALDDEAYHNQRIARMFEITEALKKLTLSENK